MAQTYAQFKTYVMKYLWRENSTDLSTHFDSIVEQSNDELDKRTKDWQRRNKTLVIAPETQDYDLTANVTDLEAVRSVSNNTADTYFASTPKTFRSTLPSDIYRMRAENPGGPVMPYYALDNDDGNKYLRLVGPFSATDPGDLTLLYYRSIPDYAAADASWLEDEHLNLYLYTVAKHIAMFEREDERVMLYKGLADEAFELAEIDDKHNQQFGGSPLEMAAHRAVP